MSNLVKFANAGLPSVAQVKTLAESLKTLQADTANVGMAILKMDRTGHWVYGADQTEVEKESEWAVNPFSFVHGYIAWGDGDVLGERMVPVSEPLPELDAAPAGARAGWQLQVGLSLKCLNGEDEGLEVRYTVTSVGGKRAVQGLAAIIAAQVDKDASKPVAVVRLKAEHYQHKSYGRIYTPVFEVLDWIGLDGKEAGQAEEEESQVSADDSDSNRRRRRA